ncbi:MAG: DUF2808 domain-containing protein [Cyanobacteriota bacterium]|nr:DUF2808 domain-containing protein [Cyanobacteriota bacterium]
MDQLMARRAGFGLMAVMSLSLCRSGSLLVGDPALAVQGLGGITYFREVPRLSHSSVSPRTTRTRGATLQFTLDLPADAEEALQTVVIEQSRNPEALRISPERIRVVAGSRWHSEAPPIPAEVTLSKEARPQIEIRFTPAIAAGSTITIGLDPISTPQRSGTYLFGIHAQPVGERPFDYFLGYGSVGFDDSGGNQRIFLPHP